MNLKLHLKYTGHGYYSLFNDKLHYVTDEGFVKTLLNTKRKVGEVELNISSTSKKSSEMFSVHHEVNGDDCYYLRNIDGEPVMFNCKIVYHVWHILGFEAEGNKAIWITGKVLKVR